MSPCSPPCHYRLTAELASADDSFLFGGKYGIGVAKKNSSEMRLIQPFWTEEETQAGKAERMRANDGAVDSKGRFWASAVCDPLVTSFTPDGEREQIPDEADGLMTA